MAAFAKPPEDLCSLNFIIFKLLRVRGQDDRIQNEAIGVERKAISLLIAHGMKNPSSRECCCMQGLFDWLSSGHSKPGMLWDDISKHCEYCDAIIG